MNSSKLRIGNMFSTTARRSSASEGSIPNVAEWEVRPGGMLVQKRNSDANHNNSPIPTIRVRVKYGSLYHEIRISPQASFGELKKKLAEPTKLHPEDQKLLFKKKEMDSREFLDVSRVKDGSKIVLIEDTTNRGKRCLEMLRNANSEKASKALSQIIPEVDKLAEKVVSLEATANSGKKIKEMDIDTLTELLMTQLIKLDGIVAEGDLKLQRRTQVRRVQKHIEALDMLKPQNSASSSNGSKIPLQEQPHSSNQTSAPTQRNLTAKRPSILGHSESFVVSTKWETFD